jgi:hypothetical protein
MFRFLALILIATLSHTAHAATDLEIRRSLIVTELSILKSFPLKRTMDQLALQTGISQMTGEKLFRQWFDIMNPRSEAVTFGPHCDDEFDPTLGVGIFNSFPFTCRPASKQSEGSEATLASDPMLGYLPITLTNRIDEAPGNGGHCGEYRIVYGRATGATDDSNRNFLIFEAAMPNPHPDLGLKGCKVIAKFWEELSKEHDSAKRAKNLERFYYNGVSEFQPAIHIRNFGDNPLGAGQLRTNQFMQPRAHFTSRIWSMREFKLSVTRGQNALIHPVTVKTNPFGALFNSAGAHPRTAAFQDHFLTQIEKLAIPDFSFGYDVPDHFNTGQAQLNGTENNYVTQLGGDLSPFGQRIQAKLTALGSSLTPTQIVSRAQAVSCAGCHRLNANPGLTEAQRSLGGGLVFPTSLDFTHSSEFQTEIVNGEEAFRISNVLTELLLPERRQILSDYLADKLKLPKDLKKAINGKSHH